MTALSNEQVFAELYYTQRIIKDVLGVTPLCWRPPYGDIDNRVRMIAAGLNLTTVVWSEDSVSSLPALLEDQELTSSPTGRLTLEPPSPRSMQITKASSISRRVGSMPILVRLFFRTSSVSIIWKQEGMS